MRGGFSLHRGPDRSTRQETCQFQRKMPATRLSLGVSSDGISGFVRRREMELAHLLSLHL
jgi:hypothetical protein